MKKIFIVVVLILTAIACQKGVISSELEKFRSDLDVESNNKIIITQVFEAIDKVDTLKVKELLTTDFNLTAPGITEPFGVVELVQAIKAHYTSFPDWKHDVEHMLAKNNKVIARVMQSGTHEVEYEGIPATNNQVLKAAVYEITIVDGKIKKLWVIEDNLGFYMQLGMELQIKETKN